MKKLLALSLLFILFGCDTSDIETVQNDGIYLDNLSTEERIDILRDYDLAIAEITNVEQGEDIYTYSLCVIDRSYDCGDVESEKIYKHVGDYVIVSEIEEGYVIIVD